jgi:hypothetical protein
MLMMITLETFSKKPGHGNLDCTVWIQDGSLASWFRIIRTVQVDISK